jgi:hypothetical protein
MIRITLAALFALVSFQAVAQIEPQAQIAKNNIFYIMDPQYGGQCNLQVNVGVSVTAGSNVVTFASYAPQQSDVGKYISITTTAGGYTGPGTGGYAYNAVIGSVSGQTATLVTAVNGSTAKNAVTTNSSAFAAFGNDDSGAIAAAEAAASAAGGGTVQFPGKGIYSGCVVANYTTLVSLVSYKGAGMLASKLKWISVGDQPHGVFYEIPAGTCSTTYAAAMSDIHLSDFEIDLTSATLNSGYQVDAKGISMPCAQRNYVEHLYVHDAPATCIATDEGFPTTVAYNVTVNCGRLSGTGYGGNGIGEGVASDGGTESFFIHDNLVVNAQHYSIYLEGQTSGQTNAVLAAHINHNTAVAGALANYVASTLTPGMIACSGVSNCDIDDNVVLGLGQNYAGSAINPNCYAADVGTLNYSYATNVRFSNNSGTGCSNGIAINLQTSNEPISSGTNASININGGKLYNNHFDGITITGSTSAYAFDQISITNVDLDLNGTSGILFATATGGFTNVNIAGNRCYGNGTITSTAWLKSCIAIGTPINNLHVFGNQANAEGASQSYALSVNTSIAVGLADIESNNWHGALTSAYDILGTLTGVVRNNVGDPTFTITSGSANTPVGGPDVGTFKTSAAGASTIVIQPFGTANIIATNGWACEGSDMTAGLQLTQTALTTTSLSLAVPAGAASGDTAQFSCRMF